MDYIGDILLESSQRGKYFTAGSWFYLLVILFLFFQLIQLLKLVAVADAFMAYNLQGFK